MTKLEMTPEILEALQKVSSLLPPDPSLTNTLQSVADLSAGVIPGCDSAGLTLRVDGQDGTAAASDDYTLEIDRIQYETHEGPCVTALEDNEFIQIEDVSQESRWPDFCRRASEHGFRSSLSFPLKGEGLSGALNVYAKTAGAFEASGIALGHLLAGQASAALYNARMFAASQHLAQELQQALKSRDLIGQAKGILMERENITDGEAFEMLRTLSQSTNVKLRDVAQKVVDQKVQQKSG